MVISGNSNDPCTLSPIHTGKYPKTLTSNTMQPISRAPERKIDLHRHTLTMGMNRRDPLNVPTIIYRLLPWFQASLLKFSTRFPRNILLEWWKKTKTQNTYSIALSFSTSSNSTHWEIARWHYDFSAIAFSVRPTEVNIFNRMNGSCMHNDWWVVQTASHQFRILFATVKVFFIYFRIPVCGRVSPMKNVRCLHIHINAWS